MTTIDGQEGLRVMFCCHEAVGLGHLSRTLNLARYLRDHTPVTSQLIVTGSPAPISFPLPEGADYVKLPSVVKVEARQYAARSLPVAIDQLLDMRRDIFLSAARHFQPDALIVDHAPGGLKGELIPTLRYLREKSPRTQLILGLRDIVDDARRVGRAWIQEGVYGLLDDCYDLILVYGRQDVYDVVSEYGFSPRAAEKTRYVGYLRREAGELSTEQVRQELDMQTDRLVVVTAGGGVDGYDLFTTMLEALRDRPEPIAFDCLLVSGPLMPVADRNSLLARANGRPGVHFLDFTKDLVSYIAAADVVVSMGGYNSVAEILSFERPAIIVPRVAPSKEQLLRAEALSRLGSTRMIHPADLTPHRLLDEVDYLLQHPGAGHAPVALDGLPAVAAELEALLLRSRKSDIEVFTPDQSPIPISSARASTS